MPGEGHGPRMGKILGSEWKGYGEAPGELMGHVSSPPSLWYRSMIVLFDSFHFDSFIGHEQSVHNDR